MSAEITPPWQAYPSLERYSMGWRMGGGESHLHAWWDYITTLPKEERLPYLQRHVPAPLSWDLAVYNVLNPQAEADELSKEQVAALTAQGLVASDVAFSNWKRVHHPYVPWEVYDDPAESTRYCTRDLYFWSRLGGLKQHQAAPIPWVGLLTDTIYPHHGLLWLAAQLAQGRWVGPWEQSISLVNFDDSFEMTMGPVSAYRLLLMSAFDDEEHLLRELAERKAPELWVVWSLDQAGLGL